MANKTLEENLLALGHFSPILPEDQGLFLRFFLTELDHERYPNSWAYVTQACRNLGESGCKFYDGQVLMGIGEHKGHYVLVNPLGKDAGVLVDSIARDLYQRSGKPVYVKHVKEVEQRHLGKGFFPMAEYPWENEAPYDDATYPEIVIDCQKMTSEETDMPANAKYRLRLHRFLNDRRIQKSFPYFSIQEYDPTHHAENVAQLIARWAGGNPAKITPYANMMQEPPIAGFNFVVTLLEQVISFHVYDRIGLHAVGSYAAVTNYTYVPGASEACFFLALAKLEEHGIRAVNLGGSETASLDYFKRKLRPYTARDTRKKHLVFIG